jgi:hypothetical protein
MFTTGFIVTSVDKDGQYYVDNMNLPFTGIKMPRCIQCIEGGEWFIQYSCCYQYYVASCSAQLSDLMSFE